ncbi:transposase, partial [Acinetobacter baumannii]
LLEISPRQIRSMLDYKAAWYGAQLIAVDPRHTSQTCSQCAAVDAASRISQAEFACTACGWTGDADINAATNILRRGLGSTGGHPGV